MLTKIPAPNPTAIAAGAVQIGHLGSSAAADGCSGSVLTAGAVG
jgi:ABC-type taurine transport system substrate-binding protein